MKIKLNQLVGGVFLAINSSLISGQEHLNHQYITTWTASPQEVWEDNFIFPTNIPKTLQNQTIRQTIKISQGGERLRIELSNAHGQTAVNLGDITIGLATSSEDTNELGKITDITFNGEKSATILPGSSLISDDVPLSVSGLSELIVSIYIPNEVKIETFHWDGRQTNFIANGNQSHSQALTGKLAHTTARLFISGIYVEQGEATTLAVLGDSITDGATASLDKNSRWTDFLAERLEPHNIAVINAGISGARLLSDGMGSNALSRLNRDILSKPGISSLIVLLGINDISWPGTIFAPDSPLPKIEELKAGFIQLVKQAHMQGVSVIGSTLPPFEGALPDTPLDNYYSKEKNQLRIKLNEWIKNSDTFDEVINFDSILRNPNELNRMSPEYDSGDHLHPGDKGNKAMAYGFNDKILNKLLNERNQKIQK